MAERDPEAVEVQWALMLAVVEVARVLVMAVVTAVFCPPQSNLQQKNCVVWKVAFLVEAVTLMSTRRFLATAVAAVEMTLLVH
jgi:hypothetical protein